MFTTNRQQLEAGGVLALVDENGDGCPLAVDRQCQMSVVLATGGRSAPINADWWTLRSLGDIICERFPLGRLRSIHTTNERPVKRLSTSIFLGLLLYTVSHKKPDHCYKYLRLRG